MSVRNVSPPSSGEGDPNIYSLKWNHYQNFMTVGLAKLMEDTESLTDVMLSCADGEGQFISAHKLILCLCSPFFKQYFRLHRMHKHADTLVLLTNIRFVDLKNIIQFIYHGEVKVRNTDLNAFLQAASVLQIQGLADAVTSTANTGGTETTKEFETLRTSNAVSVVDLQTTSSQQPVPSTSHSNPVSLPSSGSGAPPLAKRSRLSSSGSSSTAIQIHSSRTSTASPKVGTSTENRNPSLPINTSPYYDPLGDAEGSMEEDGEEEMMISLDKVVKSEPIAVYSLNDEGDDDNPDEGAGSSVDIGELLNTSGRNSNSGDQTGYSYLQRLESSSSVIEETRGPGPYFGVLQQARPSASSGPPRSSGAGTSAMLLPSSKSSEGDSGGSGNADVSEMLKMRCSECDRDFLPEEFQSHGCKIQLFSQRNVGTVDIVQCPICFRTLKNKNSLKVHKSTYHRPKQSTRVSSGLRLNHATIAGLLNRRPQNLLPNDDGYAEDIQREHIDDKDEETTSSGSLSMLALPAPPPSDFHQPGVPSSTTYNQFDFKREDSS